MKSKRLLLLLLLAIGLPWAANAQETVTVYNGTDNNTYVPFYGLYADDGVKCEFVIPADQLEDMTGGTISAMKFYLKSVGSNTISPTLTVFVKEVGSTTLTALTGTTGATTVFHNSITFTKNTTEVEIDIPFSSNYSYGDGNLLIGVYQDAALGSGNYSQTTWYGVNQTYNSAWSGSGSGSARKFLPKTTFTYTPGSTTATAPGVTTSETVASLTNTSVTLGGNITDMGGANSVQAGICWSTTNTPTTSDNHAHSRHTSAEAYTQDITGLLPNTTYYYRAYAYNSANSLEDPTYGDIYSFTTACNITLDQPANGAISASVAGGTATTSNTYALPNQSVTLTATAVSGYSFDNWIVSGVTGTASGSSYTFTMPTNNVTVTASIIPASGGSSSETYYELATSIESGEKYLIVSANSTTISASSYFYAMERNNTTSTGGILAYGTPTFKDTEKHQITDITPNTSGHPLSDFVWTITASGSDYIISAENEGSTYYLIETSSSDGSLHSYTTSDSGYNEDQTKWTIVASSNDGFLIHNSYWYSQYSTPGGRYYYLYYASGFKNYWTGTAPASQTGSGYRMYLYKLTSTTTYAISATASPAEGGTVAGSDYYANGSTCTLTATPAFGYDFVSWTEGGNVVSTDAEYTFTVSSARTLVANFESQGSCIKPTDLAQVANTQAAHQAQLSWTENSGATQWQVVYSTDSEFDPDAATPIVVTENPVTISGLAQETTYYVYVRTVCGENSQSGWSNKATFTTISGRQAPTVSYDESTLTDNSVTITWTGVATNVNHQSYDVYYSTSDATPASSQEPSFSGVTGTSQGLTGLTSQTTYYVWVRDNCGTDGTSDWSEAFSFKTACGVISNFPWRENFEGFAANIVPDCWDNSASTSSTLSSNPERIWGVYSGSNNKFLRMYNYYVQSGTALINSPSISLPSEGTYELTFKHSNRANCGAFLVKISDDGGTTFVEKGSYDATGSTDQTNPGTFTKASIPLTDYAGKTIIVQFFATANYSNGSIFIDDVEVKELVVVTANKIVNTVSDPATQMTWDEFVQQWNNGDHFTSTTFTLMDDITINEMVGTAENPFSGTFDGDNHTITVDLTATDNNFTAPFRIIKNATIQNLKVDGTINDGGFKFIAGFAGDCYGNNTFTNCVSDITLNATISGDGTHGGFIARNYGGSSTSNVCTTTFNGCAFTGKLLGESTNQSAGFCGWSEYQSPNYARTVFNNCIFAPTGLTMNTTSSATFARRRNATYVNFNNCYFMQDFNDGTNNTAQGKQAYTIAGVDPVYVAFSGEHTLYDMSGIDAYTEGMIHGYTKLAGEGDVVTLSLSGAPGYEANHGTLVANGETYTLTMEAYDTEISAVDCPVPYNVAVSNVEARSAQVAWTGNSDTYTLGYAQAVETTITYDFEDNAIPAEFTNSASYAWTVTTNDKHDGSYSIKSGGAGTNYAESDLTLTLNLQNDATISFWYKASSEADYDYGRFLIDGSQKFQTSGTSNEWTQYTGELTAGTHTLVWRYYKDSSGNYGDDCFYVDDITMPGLTAGTWTYIDNIPASPYTIENLTPETKYFVRVRGNCGSTETEYSDMVSFTTPASCIVPTGLAVSDVTTNSAYASWTAGGSETQYVVAYKKATDAEWTEVENRVDQTSYTLSNLDAATDYEVKVQAYCDADDQSDWTEVVSFTTECDVITVDLTHPFTEGFEGTTFAPQCWENIASGTHQWSKTTTSSNIHTGSGAAYSGYYGDIYLVMPDIQISSEADGAQLTFWSYNTWVSSYGKNSVVLINGENETELWSPESVSQSWVETTIDLSSYVGQTISLAFKYEGNNAHGWYIDDVEIIALQTITKEIAGYGTSAKGGYYLIASPVVENVTPAANNGFITETAANYDLYYFNQAAPVDAETGIGLEWINFKDAEDGNFAIENGKGYLYASKEGTTLSFTGTPYSGNGQVPLATTAGAEWAGWNLVGNPFAQTAYADRAYYALQNGSELTPTSATTGIGAMEGIFVVAENAEDASMTFSTTAPNSKAANLAMNVIKERNVVDRAIVSFSQGSQLPKFQLNPNHTKVFMPVEGKDYAIANAESNMGTMPVSFKAEENGTYTLNFTNEEVTFNYLHLIDNLTGTETDLLANPSYTFDARTTDYESRFKLVFATGNNANDDAFAFYSNGSFVINNEGEATLQVIDMNGRILKSESINGCANVNVKAAAGVYMLRLVNGNDVKVQKVVVR